MGADNPAHRFHIKEQAHVGAAGGVRQVFKFPNPLSPPGSESDGDDDDGAGGAGEGDEAGARAGLPGRQPGMLLDLPVGMRLLNTKRPVLQVDDVAVPDGEAGVLHAEGAAVLGRAHRLDAGHLERAAVDGAVQRDGELVAAHRRVDVDVGTAEVRRGER